VKAALIRELNSVKAEIEQLENSVGGSSTAVAAHSDHKHIIENRPRIHSVKITTYGWDQTDTSVKIYVNLDGVEKHQEKISVNFGNKSFDLKVCDLDGKNYQLQIVHLSGLIVPSESKFSVRRGMITVTLQKADKGKWDSLVPSKKKETKPKFDKDADPSQSIMDMMRQMYQDGDDDMKRTIAKAWTESREKRNDQPIP
jgi:calcyclin binding protein